MCLVWVELYSTSRPGAKTLSIIKSFDLYINIKVHHGMTIKPCRPDPNYFAVTDGSVARASASHGYTMMYMCMGSNYNQPGKKFVKNDLTNQVKFELSTLRHYL